MQMEVTGFFYRPPQPPQFPRPAGSRPIFAAPFGPSLGILHPEGEVPDLVRHLATVLFSDA